MNRVVTGTAGTVCTYYNVYITSFSIELRGRGGSQYQPSSWQHPSGRLAQEEEAAPIDWGRRLFVQ